MKYSIMEFAAPIIHAYQACPEELKPHAMNMVNQLLDGKTLKADRYLAAETLVELLFPRGSATDLTAKVLDLPPVTSSNANPDEPVRPRTKERLSSPGDVLSVCVADVEEGFPVIAIDVHHEHAGVSLGVPGYSTMGMVDSPVVLLKIRKGVPHVVVWDDIREEEPSHVISLAGAKEPEEQLE